MPGVILIIASLDTKWPEVKYLKELITRRGHKTVLLDMSMRSDPPVAADISCEAVAVAGGSKIEEIRVPDKPRDESTALMVCSAAMPSYLGGFFGSSDIALLSSVVDTAGLHELSKNVLKRAGGAICGMVESGAGSVIDMLKQSDGRLIAITEFQYSSDCCEMVRHHLEERGYTVIPCHADGVGDRAMEKLLDQGIFDAVVDIVPAGLSEEFLGGNRAAGSDRLEAAVKRGIPLVITPCGFEMISCGPLRRKDSGDPLWLSRNIAARKYYVQDEYRVQARVNAEELRNIAKILSDKLNIARGPVTCLVPLEGWSSLSVRGQVLFDSEADRTFIEELHRQLRPEIDVRELPFCLNSAEFALALVEALEEMMGHDDST
jgi:uncharacterized protein (UPF0261 family)